MNTTDWKKALSPEPQEIVCSKKTFTVTSGMKLVFSGMDDLTVFEGGLSAGLKMKYHLSVSAESDPAWLPDSFAMFLGTQDKRPAKALIPPQKQEGYILQITPDGIYISGFDRAGLFYGIRTLQQIFTASQGNIPCLTVRDYPRLTVRGYGPFFGGSAFVNDKKNIAYYRKIADIMADHKLNLISFEIGAIPFDDDLESFGKYCRDRFIEILPFHPFLCCNDPDVVKVVQASEKDFQKMMEPVDRAVRLLGSKTFMIGCDELIQDYNHVTRKSIYTADQLKKHSSAEWYSLALNRLHQYLKSHGLRMAMWADTLLNPDMFRGNDCEMKDFSGGYPDYHYQVIDSLPKDILLVDWQQTASRDYPEINYLLQKGFEVICAPILTGMVEQFMPREAARLDHPHCKGMFSVSWASARPDEFLTDDVIRTTGDSFWNAGNSIHKPEKLRVFEDCLAKKEVFQQIPEGKHDLVIEGRGENFVVNSAGRIYCIPKPEGLGAWFPASKFCSDIWYHPEAAIRKVFRSAVLELEFLNPVKCEVRTADAASAPLSDFRLAGTVKKGKMSQSFDLTKAVAGKRDFCFWLRFSGQDEIPVLKKMTLHCQINSK